MLSGNIVSYSPIFGLIQYHIFSENTVIGNRYLKFLDSVLIIHMYIYIIATLPFLL